MNYLSILNAHIEHTFNYSNELSILTNGKTLKIRIVSKRSSVAKNFKVITPALHHTSRIKRRTSRV